MIGFSKNNSSKSNDSDKEKLNLGVLLIAAGNSSRLGQAKQLVSYRNESLLEKALRLANSISETTVCVLGYEHKRFANQVNFAAKDILINPNWQLGMGTSIATGVSHFIENSANSPLDAILVLLCDQYLLTEADLKKLCHQWTMAKDQIIASRYFDDQQHVLGAPAIFPKKYFNDLLSLTHKGARNLLHRYRQDVIAIDLKNAATDLDTLNDLQQLQALNNLNTENSND